MSRKLANTERASERSRKADGFYQKWQKRQGCMMWFGRFAYQRKRYRIGPFPTKSEAKDALEDLKRDIKRRQHLKPKITFGQFADEFLAAAKLETPTTFLEYEKRLKHLKPFFSDRKLDEIKAAGVKAYRKHRLSSAKSPKPATINREVATLSKIFSVAVEDEKILYHPISRRRLKLHEEKRPVRPLLDEERIRLQAACKLHPKFDGYEFIIVTALNTGMRLMELLTLKWAAVDLESRIITVVKSKSKKPRYLPMNHLVFEALSEIDKSGEYVFKIDRQGDFKTKFEKRWKELCRLANVQNLRFHDLRATCATRLTDRKVSIRVVQAILGHSTSQVTERYIRVDKSVEDAMNSLASGQKSGQISDDDLDENP